MIIEDDCWTERRRRSNAMALNVDHLEDRLAALTARGVTHTVSGQLARIAINLIGIIVLSRLLDPNEFGIIAAATIIINIAQILAEPGFIAATIQARIIGAREVASLCYLNIAFGVFVAIATFLLAPLYASITGTPEVGPIVQALSVVFLLNGFAAQSDAVLRRRMMFDRVAVVDVVSSLAGTTVAVGAALVGVGYWALAIQIVASAVARLIGVTFASPWKPWPFEPYTDVRPLANFGLKLVAGNILAGATNAMPPLFVKAVAGVYWLGVWDRSLTIASLPSRQIAPSLFAVLTPAFARLAPDEKRFEAALALALQRIVVISAFFASLLFISADAIVALLLGPGWGEVVFLLRILAIYTAVEPVATLLATAIVAGGQPGGLLAWRFISALLLASALLVGSRWGLTGTAVAFAIVNFAIRMPLFLVFVATRLRLSLRRLAISLLPCLLFFICFNGFYASFGLPISPRPVAVDLLLGVLSSLVGFVLFVLSMPSTRRDAAQLTKAAYNTFTSYLAKRQGIGLPT